MKDELTTEIEGRLRATFEAVRALIVEMSDAEVEQHAGAIDLISETMEALSEAAIDKLYAARKEPPAGQGGEADLRNAAIEAIALLDVAIMGSVFTKPDRGRVPVNIAKAQAVLDGLRQALAAPPRPLVEET